MLVVTCNPAIKQASYFPTPVELYDFLSKTHQDQILFVHWSWRVPNYLLKLSKCYGMHTGPLLEERGRGGSPIKNLIALGVKWATLCTFEMTPEIDKGHVIAAIPISLEGSLEQIYERIDFYVPRIVEYLKQDNTIVPILFKRIQ